MKNFISHFRILLLIATSLLPWFDASLLCAQDSAAFHFRKIYVPENQPDVWPEGKWQPVSTEKFFKRLKAENKNVEQLLQAGIDEVKYQAKFENGRLIKGKFTAKLNNPNKTSAWRNLGKSNLNFQSVKWKQGDLSWGTNQAGDFILLQKPSQKNLFANWSLDGRTNSQTTQFDFKVLRATQTTVQLTLPATMQLHLHENITTNLNSTTKPPVFVRKISRELNEWTIYLTEQSSFSVSIEPANKSPENSLLLSKQVHLLNLGVSDHHFVTEFQLELPSQKITPIQVFLPTGFEPLQIEIDQKILSNWDSRPATNGSQPGSLISISVQPESIQTPISIRLKGNLKHFNKLKLKTRFPQIQNVLQTETQVTIFVEPPFHTKSLETTSLLQVDARLGSAIRDTWTYSATGIDPSIDISVEKSIPELQVDQIIFCPQQQENNEATIHQFLFLSAKQEGLFTGRFKLRERYQVQELAVLSERNMPVPVTWNIQSESNNKFLYLHLPNQLVAGQRLAVSITLHSKLFRKNQTRISLPALELVNGKTNQSLLLTHKTKHLKLFPQTSLINKIPFSELLEWSAVWKQLQSDTASQWEMNWVLNDISQATRIIVEQNRETISSKTPAVEQKAAQEPSIESTKKIQQIIPIERNSKHAARWKCQVQALVHNTYLSSTRLQIRYDRIDQQAKFPKELEFEQNANIKLHSVTINDHLFSIEKQARSFVLPDIKQPYESVFVNYSINLNKTKSLALPVNVKGASYHSVLLCLPNNMKPKQKGNVLFSQPLPFTQRPSSAVDPAFSETILIGSSLNNDSTAFARLLKNQVLKHDYRLYQIHLPQQEQVSQIQLNLTTITTSWGNGFAVFAAAIMLCLFFNLQYQFSPRVWLSLSILASFLAACLLDSDQVQFFFPVMAAFFVAAQLPGSFIKWVLQKTRPQKKLNQQRKGSLRYLLTGSHCLLIAIFWLNAQTLSGQPVSERSQKRNQKSIDFLIPVNASLLTPEFPGLKPAQFPEIIYLPKAFSKQLREQENKQDELNEGILLRSANYSATWTQQGKLLIHCKFRILDSRIERKDPFILAISKIDSLPLLKAKINGQSTNITPLPDETGLEIPLPESSEELKDSAVKHTNEERRFQPREHIIELDVFPTQNVLAQGTEFTLAVPPVAQCLFRHQIPEQFNAKLIRAEQDNLELHSNRSKMSLPIPLGLLQQLKIMIQTDSENIKQATTQNYEEIQTAIITQVHPQYIALHLQTKVKFAATSQRTMRWKIPAGIVVRSVHSLPVVDHNIKPNPKGGSLLELNIPDLNPLENTILIKMILPTNAAQKRKVFSLPTLADIKPEHNIEQQWQIALQADSGFELSQINFPDTATSRITPTVFTQSWAEQELLSPDALCYRIQNPGQIQVELLNQESELSVIAQHSLETSRSQIQLQSNFQVDVIGQPIWGVNIQIPDHWKLDQLKLTSQGITIPTRILKQNQGYFIATAQAIEESFELEIHSAAAEKDHAGIIKITPTRIQQTLYYQENFIELPNDSDSHLNFASRDSQKPKQPLDINNLQWVQSIQIDADNENNLPAIYMQILPEEKPAGKSPASSPVKNKPIAEPQISPSDREKISATISQEKISPTISLDHTIWKKKQFWFGETLCLLNFSDQNKDQTTLKPFRLKIPKQIQILDFSSHASLRVKVDQENLLIETASHQVKTPDVGLVLIHWKQPVKFSFTGNHAVFPPTMSENFPVAWRMLDTNATRSNRALGQKTWMNYLSVLSYLSSREEKQENLKKPLTSKGPQPGLENNLEQAILQATPQQLQKRMYHAQNMLRDFSWVIPIETETTHVIAAGKISSSSKPISLPDKTWWFRFAILFFAAFWGWGMLQVMHVQKPKIRRRHLVFCSFLILGLISVLMT